MPSMCDYGGAAKIGLVRSAFAAGQVVPLSTCYGCIVAGCVTEARQDDNAPRGSAGCRCRRDCAASPATSRPRFCSDAWPLWERCASSVS